MAPSPTVLLGVGGELIRIEPALGFTDWTRSFYINLPFGAFAALAMGFAFRPPKAAAPANVSLAEKILQLDLVAMVLICAAVVCFSLSMRWAGVEKAWGSADVIGTLVGSVLITILFVVEQWYQGERALCLPRFIKNKTLIVGFIFELL